MRESMNEVTGMQNENLLQDSVKSTVETAILQDYGCGAVAAVWPAHLWHRHDNRP